MKQSVHILPVGIGISLLSVVPGEETRVANHIQQSFGEQSLKELPVILKLFGRYDVCVIYRTSDFFSDPNKIGAVDGIRSGNLIFSFAWHSDGTSDFLVPNPDLKVWGLLFFRIKEPLAQEYGSLIEEMLASWWYADSQNILSKNGDVAIDILGTTGWAEVVFIVRGKEFRIVTEILSHISQGKIDIQSGTTIQTNLFSAKTFSLIGVNFQDIDIRSRNLSQISETFNEEYKIHEGVYPTLNVTCAPGDMQKVHQYARDNFGDDFTTFGSQDFLIYPSACRTWGQLIGTVLQMRRDLASSLYDTAIDIFRATDEIFEDFPSHKKNHQSITINRKLLNTFKKWGPDFENSLLNLYFGINNLLQDPLIGDCFNELREMTASRLPELLRTLNPKDHNNLHIVGEIVEALEYGAEERANGAFLAIEQVENRFSPTKGGIQRILKAAQVVANQIMSRVGMHYRGFMVAGFMNEGFSSHGEIINLPFEYLFQPEEWWGLFHEIGHVAIWDTDFTDSVDFLEHPTVTSVLKETVANQKDETRLDFWKDQFMEIAADSFDLYLCHGSDLSNYLRNIWPYITKLQDIQEEHFARYFCMFQYWKYLLKKGGVQFPNEIVRQSDLNLFKELLVDLKLLDSKHPVLNSRSYDKNALIAFTNTSRVIELCHSFYLRKQKKEPDKERKVSNNTNEALNTILKGEIYNTDIIEQPDKFILDLKKNQQSLTLDCRIAAILSLWHTALVIDHNER